LACVKAVDAQRFFFIFVCLLRWCQFPTQETLPSTQPLF
jgi:hypothetical protein